VGLQLLAMTMPPLRSLLGLAPGASTLELGAFGAGLAFRWLLANRPGDLVIVRLGNAPRESRSSVPPPHGSRRADQRI
jgi:hypothetical protein